MLFSPKTGYSFLIRPIQIVIDLTVCLLLMHVYYNELSMKTALWLSLIWLVASVFSGFYVIYRFTSIVTIFRLLIQQMLLVALGIFSFYGITKHYLLDTSDTLWYLCILGIIVVGFKLCVYYLLKCYRFVYQGNRRRVVVLGDTEKAQELVQFFKSRQDMGYHLKAVFKNISPDGTKSMIHFIKNHKVDELYCTIDRLSNTELNAIVNFCGAYDIVLKFIPENTLLSLANFKMDYYHYSPVVSLSEVKLHQVENVIVKRCIDIIISILVILLVLSWLTPLLAIILRLESRGALFYVHERNGVNYKPFTCYKFRSMYMDSDTDRLHVSKQDHRVTKLGRLLRRSSIDELPQFWNVLKGDMSIVGPRPHMPQYTKTYSEKIDKYQYIFRHSVKPGITGLAQIKGYRGEIRSDKDIINRIKYDIYYIQNWSITMDIGILFSTIAVLIKGQENAY